MNLTRLLGPFFLAAVFMHCSGEDIEEFYPAKSPAPLKNGNRLKRLYTEWTTEDGLQVVQTDAGIWDDQLKMKCSFQLAEDGQSRCLPINGENAAFIIYTRYFLDSNCTKQFVIVNSASPNCMTTKISYALLGDSSAACSTSSQPGNIVFRVAAKPETPDIIYTTDQNKCEALDRNFITNLLAGKQVLEVLDQVSPSTFVGGQRSIYQYP